MKAKITADAILQILLSIFNDEEVNTVIDDPSSEWNGKTIMDVLNVEYLAFKHRPQSTEDIIYKKMNEGEDFNVLEGVSRSFCILSLDEVERTYAKDVDVSAVEANLEFWVHTDKIKLLEYLFEDCAIATSGIRIPVVFGKQTRQAVIVFKSLEATDIQAVTQCGEIIVCDMSISMMFYPDVASYGDYTVTFSWQVRDEVKEVTMPVSSFDCMETTATQSVPRIDNRQKVGSINLSRALVFTLTFDGYNNDFVNYISSKTLASDTEDDDYDNNKSFIMWVTRGTEKYMHDVVITQHRITVSADTGNETHTLTLSTRGI